MVDHDLEILEKGFIAADKFINRQYLDLFSYAPIYSGNEAKTYSELKLNGKLDTDDIRIIKINKIVINNKKNIIPELSNLYNALYNLNISSAVIVKGTLSGVELYIAVRAHDSEVAGKLLKASLESNLPGIKINNLKDSDKNFLMQNMDRSEDGVLLSKGLATVSLIPTIREDEEEFSQGLERFIDAMYGKNYVAVFLSAPLGHRTIENMRRGYEEIYSSLSPYAKFTYTYGENVSHAISKGISSSFSTSVNHSISNSNSSSTSSTDGSSSGETDSSNWGAGGWSTNTGTSSSTSSSYTSGSSFGKTISDSVAEAHADGATKGDTKTEGSSESKTINYENKSVENLMKQIEIQLERINLWESYGLWENCAYFFSNDVTDAVLAATTYKSLMIGDKSGIEKAHVNVWSAEIQNDNIKKILKSIKELKHPTALIPKDNQYDEQLVTPTSLVSGKELALLQGLPCKSVLGVSVQEMAEFGRSVVYEGELPKNSVSIGNVYHMGIENKNVPVNMDLNMFSSHCFITGSSGSGKSVATYNLIDKLLENGIKMLVVEPTKGEYKTIFKNIEKLNVFSVEIEKDRFLRINPFVFPDNIHILAHIEQLMQIFSAAWPLSAAMPSVLKSAIIKSYINVGWDINRSMWIEGYSKKKYPNFYDLRKTLPNIINSSDFSKEVKGNYTGALLMRVSAMTSGINDLIFNKSDGISNEEMFDNNTIIDLSELGAEESISLIMGMIILKLNEYRKYQRKKGLLKEHDAIIHHVTILEEAHNILKRTNKGQSMDGANMVGKSVEMISNSIKEMRTYGEGFIIIDQSPLAVDLSAIENSATKIVMNTPSREACQELGSALSLNEEQIRELSKLNRGVAAIMQKGWMMPVLTKVNMWNDKKYNKLEKIKKEEEYKTKPSVSIIRGELVRVLIKQIKLQEFTGSKFCAVINKSSLPTSQKIELKGIWDIYQKYREQNEILNEVMLGHLFMEICDCRGLFDIIPTNKLTTYNDIINTISKLGPEKRTKYENNIHYLAQIWVDKFKNSLQQYIDIDDEAKSYVTKYTVAYICDSGKKSSSVFSHVYYTMKNNDDK